MALRGKAMFAETRDVAGLEDPVPDHAIPKCDRREKWT